MKLLYTSFIVFIFTYSNAQDKNYIDSLELTVLNYHKGFINKNPKLLRSSISNQLNMVNGNYSENPENWQAHLFLNEKEIDTWIDFMFSEVAPFKNAIIFKSHHIRSNSAIVITKESGKNKFRSWANEEVVYHLGKIDNNWKILSFLLEILKIQVNLDLFKLCLRLNLNILFEYFNIKKAQSNK